MTPTLKHHPDAQYCVTCSNYYIGAYCSHVDANEEFHIVDEMNRHEPASYGKCRVCLRNMSVRHDSVVKTMTGYVHNHCHGKRG